MAQANPAGYFKAASLTVKVMKTKHSLDICEILDQTAQMLAQRAAAGIPPPAPPKAGHNKKSQSLKLPQNTNEGA